MMFQVQNNRSKEESKSGSNTNSTSAKDLVLEETQKENQKEYDDRFKLEVARYHIDSFKRGGDIRHLPELTIPNEASQKVLISEVRNWMETINTSSVEGALAWTVGMRIIKQINSEAAAPLEENALKLEKVILSANPEFVDDNKIEDLDKFMRQVRLTSLLFPQYSIDYQKGEMEAIRKASHSLSSESITEYAQGTMKTGQEQSNSYLEKGQKMLSNYLGFGENEFIRSLYRRIAGKNSHEFEVIGNVVKVNGRELNYSTKGGDVWKLEPFNNLHSQFAVTLRNVNTDATLTIKAKELASLIIDLKLDEKLGETNLAYAAEQNDSTRKGLASLDLTKNGTALITVVSNSHDELTSATIVPSFLLENALMKRYGKVIDPQLIVSDSPTRDLYKSISEIAKNHPEVKHLVIQVHEHGSENEILFKEPINAKDFAQLGKDFPNIKLHIVSIACFGGGLRPGLEKEFEKDTTLRDRINLFAQTKPNMENIALLIKDDQDILRTDISTSSYMLILIDQLLNENIKTFGDAINNADRIAKEKTSIDAESLVNGDLYSLVLPPRNAYMNNIT